MTDRQQQGRFEGRTAIVTGAGTGIGAACASQLAARGAAVALIGRRREKLEAVAASIRDGGGRAIVCPGDVSVAGDVSAAVDAAATETGALDVVVTAAGIQYSSPIDQASEDRWQELVDIVLKGVWLVCRASIPELKRRGHGAIVNVASIGGFLGWPDQSAYGPAKAAVRQLSRQLAVELASNRIRVNSVSPGWIDTPLTDLYVDAAPDPEAARQTAIDASPLGSALGRMGTPDDVAAAVLYLASDDAGFVTGTDLVVDGGYSAR